MNDEDGFNLSPSPPGKGVTFTPPLLGQQLLLQEEIKAKKRKDGSGALSSSHGRGRMRGRHGGGVVGERWAAPGRGRCDLKVGAPGVGAQSLGAARLVLSFQGTWSRVA